jgi:hypothetical protein
MNQTSLVNEFGVDGADADEVLGYDNDGDDDDDAQGHQPEEKELSDSDGDDGDEDGEDKNCGASRQGLSEAGEGCCGKESRRESACWRTEDAACHGEGMGGTLILLSCRYM